MPKNDWGRKHRCDCGAKIYDLGRNEFDCPVCGQHIQAVAELSSSKPEERDQAQPVDATEVPDAIGEHEEILSPDDDIEMDSDEVSLDSIANVPAEEET